MADAPLVSVLIPTHQRREAVRRALLRARRADRRARQLRGDRLGRRLERRHRGDAGGAANSLRRSRSPPGRRAVGPPPATPASPVARGEILIVLDDDMQPAPGFVERHRSHHPPGSRRCALGAVPIELDDSSPRAARYVADEVQQPPASGWPSPATSSRRATSTPATPRCGPRRCARSAASASPSPSTATRTSTSGCGCGRPASSSLYEPAALARQEYDKGLKALCGDTIQKGRTTVILARMHPEVFASLRLARPWDNSRPWIVARAAAARPHAGGSARPRARPSRLPSPSSASAPGASRSSTAPSSTSPSGQVSRPSCANPTPRAS